MSAVAVMAAQNSLGFDGIQMARKAREFKVIPAVRMMRRRPRRPRGPYAPPLVCKLLNFRQIP
jgi:hypothetical protein